MVGLLDRFKNEDENSGGEMVQERPVESESVDNVEEYVESQPEPKTDNQPNYTSTMSESSSSEIGIDALMNKRVKLEEAIDYVGLMIKNLKDKRTKLEKDIEEESVDIKNLKEKLVKVKEYIDEENKGIQELTQKRSQVESEADEVSGIIGDLKNKLSGIDGIINAEGDKIKNFKESRPKLD